MRRATILVALGASLLLAGCASMQLPDENVKPGETVAAAGERGAENNPEANKHLQAAKTLIEEAEELQSEDEEEEAKLKLIEAQAEADYALALLRRDDVRAEAKEIREKVRSIEADMSAEETQ